MTAGTLVWMDHQEARIFQVALGKSEETIVSASKGHVHRHPKDGRDHHHPDDATRFFDAVARALEGSERILLVGPSTAKLEFLRHVATQHRSLEAKLVGVESADHPSDAQLAAHAKRYFGVAEPRV